MTTGKTYTPQRGSIAWQVIEFFTTNPDEELTTSDLEAKFGKAAVQFHSLLAYAVEAGALVRRTNGDDELVYAIGTGSPLVQPKPARHPSPRPDALLAGADMGKRTRNHTAPVAIDLDAIVLRSDVPVPTKRTGKRDWTPLFTRMQVGQSCTLPLSVHGSLRSACTKAKRDGIGTFQIQANDATEILTLWRTA